MTLAAFTRRPQCAKCTGTMFSWKHVATSVHLEGKGECPVALGDAGEHLDLRCMDCGFTFGMKTADTK